MQLYLGLKKDTTTALRTVIKFLCSIKETEEIKNIFSIGFSYSDVDMKIIDIIGLLDATSWYINNYRFDNIYEYMYKIYRCTRDIDVNNFMSCHRFSLIRCRKSAHFPVMVSIAYTIICFMSASAARMVFSILLSGTI